ncbi:hypothetical protein OCF84_21455 (plasmid) [Shewanella xiamenensis]|uniref:Uncharacterized protein n=1 Tax=Shewanella xiamenensis TaxID=332186 RepID=A0ABT6UGD3_9GAMM|nr:hypothetical protein [Shewanella xiamenensis]MDI5832556.1 hypothetical protein [Shewanella xiamenensis]WHF57826.1 hypothetical protein OCF84_21455 [Shewanella xiamenensis]
MLKQADKAKCFDWLVSKLEDGSLEMLFKEDDSDDKDFDSVSSLDGLIFELELAGVNPKLQRSGYVNVTAFEFERIRQEIYSSYSQCGCMDDDAVEEILKAYRAIQKVEKRNDITPLS